MTPHQSPTPPRGVLAIDRRQDRWIALVGLAALVALAALLRPPASAPSPPAERDRVVVTPLGYTLLTGVGATYATTVWTVRHTQSITAAVAPVATLALSGYRNGTDAEAFAAVWASPVAMVL